MTYQETINNELNKREQLVNDVNFRRSCIKIAKKMGISAKEWNENKATYLMWFANQMVAKMESENA